MSGVPPPAPARALAGLSDAEEFLIDPGWAGDHGDAAGAAAWAGLGLREDLSHRARRGDAARGFSAEFAASAKPQLAVDSPAARDECAAGGRAGGGGGRPSARAV